MTIAQLTSHADLSIAIILILAALLPCCSSGGSYRLEATWQWRGAFSPVGILFDRHTLAHLRHLSRGICSSASSFSFSLPCNLHGIRPASANKNAKVQWTLKVWTDRGLPFLYWSVLLVRGRSLLAYQPINSLPKHNPTSTSF